MKSIKFDFSCFKPDFQEYVLQKLGCSNYFEFVNSYNNTFTLNIETYNQQKDEIPVIDAAKIEDSSLCEFKNYELTLNETSDSESDDEQKDVNIDFTHVIENQQIILTPGKKFIPKKMSKLIKKNMGVWLKHKNIWTLPLSAKNFVETTLKSSNSKPFNINQEKDKVIIYPKQDHPKYGASAIYDKTGNIGIWDNNIKGWVFQKKDSS